MAKTMRAENKPDEEIPAAFYYIATEKGWDVNAKFEEIKAESEKGTAAVKSAGQTAVDFGKTGIRQNTMLHILSAVLEKLVGRIRQVLANYKKLFCYSYREKKYIESPVDPRLNKLFSFGQSLLDYAVPLILDTLTKVLSL
ncbi:MAG: hypothetical protein P4M11_01005 [Candidatus Pacebacteria bacterium]|nr:hypothetical protein [Candidatus Paceibacterota bacterium]